MIIISNIILCYTICSWLLWSFWPTIFFCCIKKFNVYLYFLCIRNVILFTLSWSIAIFYRTLRAYSKYFELGTLRKKKKNDVTVFFRFENYVKKNIYKLISYFGKIYQIIILLSWYLDKNYKIFVYSGMGRFWFPVLWINWFLWNR